MKRIRIKYGTIVVILLFMATGCSASPVTERSISPAQTSQVSLTATPSPTFTPVDVNTQTPFSTLSPTQVAEVIKELYANNGGCQLPCLVGIIPGETSIQQVYEKFSQIGDFEDQTRNVDTYQRIAFATKISPNDLVGTLHDNRWGFSMRVNEDVVIGIVTDATSVEEFSVPALSKFLAAFGKPEEIWVREIETMSGNSDYEMILYYPSKGIFIRWRGESQSIVSQSANSVTVRVCPQDMPTKADTKRGLFPPHFYLFSPTANMPLEEIIKTQLAEDPGSSYQLLPSAELDKFYDLYLDPTTQDCFPFSYSW